MIQHGPSGRHHRTRDTGGGAAFERRPLVAAIRRIARDTGRRVMRRPAPVGPIGEGCAFAVLCARSIQERAEHEISELGQGRFRVKLHPDDGVQPVHHPHDLAVVARAVTVRTSGTVSRAITSEWYRVARKGDGRPVNTPVHRA